MVINFLSNYVVTSANLLRLEVFTEVRWRQ